jgi:hypothetical protein
MPVVNIRDTNDPEAIYIGRAGHGKPGTWGNPFRLGPHEERGSTLARYEAHMRARLTNEPALVDQVRALHRKTLMCFCAPLPCHGDILLKLAAELQAIQDTEEAILRKQHPYD